MRKHYEQHLGAPLEATAVNRGVRVSAFNSPFPDCVVLATDGMREVVAPPEQRPIELVMLAAPAHRNTCAVMLCDLAHYPNENGTPLHRFHVLPLGLGIVPGSRLTSLLLTMPWFRTAEFYTCVLDRRVDLVQVIPITEAERALFKASGVEALESALEDADVDLIDLERGSAV